MKERNKYLRLLVALVTYAGVLLILDILSNSWQLPLYIQSLYVLIALLITIIFAPKQVSRKFSITVGTVSIIAAIVLNAVADFNINGIGGRAESVADNIYLQLPWLVAIVGGSYLYYSGTFKANTKIRSILRLIYIVMLAGSLAALIAIVTFSAMNSKPSAPSVNQTGYDDMLDSAQTPVATPSIEPPATEAITPEPESSVRDTTLTSKSGKLVIRLPDNWVACNGQSSLDGNDYIYGFGMSNMTYEKGNLPTIKSGGSCNEVPYSDTTSRFLVELYPQEMSGMIYGQETLIRTFNTADNNYQTKHYSQDWVMGPGAPSQGTFHTYVVTSSKGSYVYVTYSHANGDPDNIAFIESMIDSLKLNE